MYDLRYSASDPGGTGPGVTPWALPQSVWGNWPRPPCGSSSTTSSKPSMSRGGWWSEKFVCAFARLRIAVSSPITFVLWRRVKLSKWIQPESSELIRILFDMYRLRFVYSDNCHPSSDESQESGKIFSKPTPPRFANFLFDSLIHVFVMLVRQLCSKVRTGAG